jgi:hypothetical protein
VASAIFPWLPDWRNESAYPNPKNTRAQQWAWEFLRRNSEYQRLHKQLIKPKSKSAKILGFKAKFHIMATDLTRPPPPSENEPKDLIFDMPFILYRGPSKSGPIPLEGFAIEQNQLLAVFNLSWPISPQVAIVKRALLQSAKETHQRVKFRLTVRHYQTYLRVLDAKLANASNKEIARVLYSKLSDHHSALQRVRDDLKAAERLCGHDFWLVAASSS